MLPKLDHHRISMPANRCIRQSTVRRHSQQKDWITEIRRKAESLARRKAKKRAERYIVSACQLLPSTYPVHASELS